MAERVVVDTDVVSFFLKGDTRARRYEKHLQGKQLVLSFMTIAELHRWSLERSWGEERKARLEEYLRKFIVSPADTELCKIWGQIQALAKAKGRPIGVADAWIAATAVRYNIPLVTHNLKHYSNVDELSVLSEQD